MCFTAPTAHPTNMQMRRNILLERPLAHGVRLTVVMVPAYMTARAVIDLCVAFLPFVRDEAGFVGQSLAVALVPFLVMLGLGLRHVGRFMVVFGAIGVGAALIIWIAR